VPETLSLGFLAAALTTGAWVPQLVRSWRQRSSRDLSWTYLATTATGLSLWLAYGLSTGDGAIIAANLVSLVLALCVCGCKAVRSNR
jgi:MtN3 and saliva related transmembrane protein